MENWFVVVMGLCTVFVVLILIIVLCWLLGLVCKALGKKETAEAPKAAPALMMPPFPTARSSSQPFPPPSRKPAAPTHLRFAFSLSKNFNTFLKGERT